VNDVNYSIIVWFGVGCGWEISFWIEDLYIYLWED